VGINTAKVVKRRRVEYTFFEELLQDGRKMVQGPVRTLGNWTPGQVMLHLAKTMNASIDGMNVQFPFHLKLMGWLFRSRIMNSQVPPGFKIPDSGKQLLEPPPVTVEEGFEEMEKAVNRIRREPNRVRHPLLGDLTRQEWDHLHLSHAELHMSFLIPETAR
jgi:Protein of unknown function (DUF1569)